MLSEAGGAESVWIADDEARGGRSELVACLVDARGLIRKGKVAMEDVGVGQVQEAEGGKG